jgi:hypothetical protein
MIARSEKKKKKKFCKRDKEQNIQVILHYIANIIICSLKIEKEPQQDFWTLSVGF